MAQYEFLKAVDVTKHCEMSMAEIAKLRYSIGPNGMVAVVHYRNRERNNGSFGYYLMSKLAEIRNKDYFFQRHARLLGINPEKLFELINENKPILQ